MRELRGERRVWRRHGWLWTVAAAFLALSPSQGLAQAGQPPLPDEIQRRREEVEKRKQDFHAEKAKVEEFNARAQRYKELRESIPFAPVVGTSNLVQVYVNRHNVRQIADQLYSLTVDPTPEGFQRDYWRHWLVLNQASRYDGRMPSYGTLDPQRPEQNVAVFPNIRKRGLVPVVADITPQDSLFAIQLTTPVVQAYERRLRDGVNKQVAEIGEPLAPTGPATLPAETNVALFARLQAEPSAQYPPRRITDETRLAAAQRVERPPVIVDAALATDPAPPAWSLRQEVSMLGPDYEGYDVEYQPGNFELFPEGGAFAFFGGRNPQGEPTTQPGVYFSFNQKILHLLLFNETAFAAFSASDAPAVNGGTLSVGLDFDISDFNLAGLVGVSAFNVVGETETGFTFTGKLRVLLTPRLYLGAIYTISDAEHFQVDADGAKRNGIIHPGFVGISVTVR